jgi:hypothetical protein
MIQFHELQRASNYAKDKPKASGVFQGIFPRQKEGNAETCPRKKLKSLSVVFARH